VQPLSEPSAPALEGDACWHAELTVLATLGLSRQNGVCVRGAHRFRVCASRGRFSRFEKLDAMFLGIISLALIADGLRLCWQALARPDWRCARSDNSAGRAFENRGLAGSETPDLYCRQSIIGNCRLS
jgi:hypothetical protein